jgi:hypothetical protein
MTAARRTILSISAILVANGASMVNAGELKISSAANLATPGVEAQILNGKVAVPRAWPATFVFRTDEGGCTATAIGSQVLLTAAHCVGNGQMGTITAGAMTATVVCTHHPDYPARISADFALCRLDAALKAPDLGFETLSMDAAIPAEKDKVVLLGYGCRAKGGTDRQFGVLFQGDATVTRRPLAEDWYVLTQGAALCYGDSGGGAFTKEGVGRRVFGVNSRGDINTNSWLSSTAATSFRDWVSNWAKDNKVEVCGLGAKPTTCRQ